MSLVPLVILSIGCSLAWVAVIFLYLRAGQVRAALLRLLDERVHSAPKATSAASSLEIIDALRYRANLLDTVTEGRLSHKISTLSVSESNRAIEDGTRDPLLGRFQNATLLTARVEMRDGSSAIVIRGQGTRGPVFERRLREFLAPYLLFGREICFGLRDQLLCDSLFEGFASFGFAYTVCLPVGRMESAPTEREVLWCGFLQGKRPNERELQYLLQLASQRGEQQLAERVRAAESGERERVDFLAHISHDMRSPLYNVKSIVNILRLENPAPETVELLEVARANCESLEEIIGDVLDLTRHGVGKLRASPEIFDLRACVQQVVEAFAVSARAKGLQLQCSLHDDCLPIRGDRRHLKRAISNIISNAIKYTPAGIVFVGLRNDAEGSSILTIKDSGRGMSTVELA
ncbi:MAG: HAMP domain-containing histidine kinase [Deltaproteobacteria bacterium]|nr:HAMP domain-containing histidine kinase [Deltaproteobacteria bacterium]